MQSREKKGISVEASNCVPRPCPAASDSFTHPPIYSSSLCAGSAGLIAVISNSHLQDRSEVNIVSRTPSMQQIAEWGFGTEICDDAGVGNGVEVQISKRQC